MQLALSEGRLTRWEDVLDELTPHDMAVLLAFRRVHPFGAERDDLRAAVNTAATLAGWGQECDWERLTDYLGQDTSNKQDGASPNAVAMMVSMARPRQQ